MLHSRPGRKKPPEIALRRFYNGPGWIRTSVGSRQWIYSPSPLATRAPTRSNQVIYTFRCFFQVKNPILGKKVTFLSPEANRRIRAARSGLSVHTAIRRINKSAAVRPGDRKTNGYRVGAVSAAVAQECIPAGSAIVQVSGARIQPRPGIDQNRACRTRSPCP
jgi:hypothetical protein